jgi:voltage-gated potassium channel
MFEASKSLAQFRASAYTVIFEADTRAGRFFDLALIWLIVASVAVVLLDSLDAVHQAIGTELLMLEWFFTLVFTVEYIARVWCAPKPVAYMRSFYGIVDFLAVLPTYLAVFAPGLHALIDIRVLRLLRLFRLLKLTAYVAEYGSLARALNASRRKVFVFLSFVAMVVLIMGTVMYVVEGPENGFTSIPISVYWAIMTMTTVGFGDIVPHSDLGRIVSSVMMLLGWGILAVPTGIVSAEFVSQRERPTTRTCRECMTEGHLLASKFCRDCGAELADTDRAE